MGELAFEAAQAAIEVGTEDSGGDEERAQVLDRLRVREGVERGVCEGCAAVLDGEQQGCGANQPPAGGDGFGMQERLPQRCERAVGMRRDDRVEAAGQCAPVTEGVAFDAGES